VLRRGGRQSGRNQFSDNLLYLHYPDTIHAF
jgi:hypothetical protein